MTSGEKISCRVRVPQTFRFSGSRSYHPLSSLSRSLSNGDGRSRSESLSHVLRMRRCTRLRRPVFWPVRYTGAREGVNEAAGARGGQSGAHGGSGREK